MSEFRLAFLKNMLYFGWHYGNEGLLCIYHGTRILFADIEADNYSESIYRETRILFERTGNRKIIVNDATDIDCLQ